MGRLAREAQKALLRHADIVVAAHVLAGLLELGLAADELAALDGAHGDRLAVRGT